LTVVNLGLEATSALTEAKEIPACDGDHEAGERKRPPREPRRPGSGTVMPATIVAT
jgi:hypothetical protein